MTFRRNRTSLGKGDKRVSVELGRAGLCSCFGSQRASSAHAALDSGFSVAFATELPTTCSLEIGVPAIA